MVLALTGEVYCAHNLLISFFILVSHMPLFVLIPRHCLSYFFGHFLLVLGTFPGVDSVR